MPDVEQDKLRVFQSFIDDAVANGVGPGFQCVIFNSDSLIFSGASGLAIPPSEDAPQGIPFTPETILSVASCTKIAISLITLHIVERGMCSTGFTMNDLDSHEALVKILPEFKHGSGSLVTKIIEGFEDGLGPDGKKIMKLRDARGQVTLRALLTHTAGLAYEIAPPWLPELFHPSDGSTPHFAIGGFSGNIRDFEIPLIAEPNTTYLYGNSGDWLGQFAIRSTKKHLRQLLKEIIFEPLGIFPTEADIFLPPSLNDFRAAMHTRSPGNNGFSCFPYRLYQTEGEPPEGKAHVASGGISASLQGYAKVLQAVLRRDPRILSESTWKMAMKDDLEDRGIKVPRPLWTSALPQFAPTVDEYAKSTTEDGTGVNLLQCLVAKAPTLSGRPTGSFGWCGLSNIYYFIDPANDIGAMFGTQLMPFYDTQVVEKRDELEALIYKTLVNV